MCARRADFAGMSRAVMMRAAVYKICACAALLRARHVIAGRESTFDSSSVLMKDAARLRKMYRLRRYRQVFVLIRRRLICARAVMMP